MISRICAVLAVVALVGLSFAPEASAHHGAQQIQVQRVRVRQPLFARRNVVVRERFVAAPIVVQQPFVSAFVAPQQFVYSQQFVQPFVVTQPLVIQQGVVTEGFSTQSFYFSY